MFLIDPAWLDTSDNNLTNLSSTAHIVAAGVWQRKVVLWWKFTEKYFKKRSKNGHLFTLKRPSCCIMDPNKSASAPPQQWGDEKSSMVHAPPPPYQDQPYAGYPQPGPGYPQPGPGAYPPQQQVRNTRPLIKSGIISVISQLFVLLLLLFVFFHS